MTYWIVVGSEENMRIAEERGFDMFGFKSTRSKEAAKMQPGDRLIFYLTKIMKFGGQAEVTGGSFEDHSPVFKSNKPGEDYPHRIPVKPLVVLKPEEYLDVRELAPLMEYPKKWPAEHWRLAFQGNLHQIPEGDFKMLDKLMRKAVGS